jgi:hypothetical protein
MASRSRVNRRLFRRRDPDSESALRALGFYGGGHLLLPVRFAFTRRRTDGAGGRFGIERMSNRTARIGEGGGVVLLVVIAGHSGRRCG